MQAHPSQFTCCLSRAGPPRKFGLSRSQTGWRVSNASAKLAAPSDSKSSAGPSKSVTCPRGDLAQSVNTGTVSSETWQKALCKLLRTDIVHSSSLSGRLLSQSQWSYRRRPQFCARIGRLIGRCPVIAPYRNLHPRMQIRYRQPRHRKLRRGTASFRHRVDKSPAASPAA